MPKKVNSSAVPGRPYLKDKNTAYLWSFVGINLAVFLAVLVSKQLAGPPIEHFWNRVAAKDGIIAACIPVLTIVLSGLLSDVTKSRLVFWRWRNPLPGCRAFSELMETDPRVDAETLRRKHGELPSDPQSQNLLWYRWYRKHSELRVISEAHRTYLLTRDLTGISAVFAAFFPVGSLMASVDWRVVGLYAVALLVQYLALATSARNYGVRFVLDVLAEESRAR